MASSSSTPDTQDAPDPGAGPKPLPLRIRLVPFLVGATFFLQFAGANIMLPPLARVFELAICREYYLARDPGVVGPDGYVEEGRCKEDAIQAELAGVVGTMTVLAVVCSLLVVVPFGYVSDRVGRRAVLLLNVLGIVLSCSWILLVVYAWETFPVRAMYAAPLFYMMGGSAIVGTANALAIVADVSEDLQERTRIFAYFNTINRAILLLSPAIGSFVLSLDLWLPFFIGIGSIILSVPFILALPDTRMLSSINSSSDTNQDRPYSANEGGNDENDPLLDRDDESDEAENPRRKLSGDESTSQKIQELLHFLWRDCRRMAKLFCTSRNVAFSLLVLFLRSFAAASSNVMMLYISKRYHWTIAQAGYLFTIKAAVTIFLFTAVIPLGMYVLTEKLGQTKERTNVILTQMNLFFFIIGNFMIGFASQIPALITGLVLYALGAGVSLLILSLVTSEVHKTLDKKHTAQLYSVAGLVEAMGDIIGIPVMAATWAAGINIGGLGLGTPFFISTGLGLLTSLVVWGIQVG